MLIGVHARGIQVGGNRVEIPALSRGKQGYAMIIRKALWGLAVVFVLTLLTAAADKPPAQYKSSGAFTGGAAVEGLSLSGVRFGKHTGYTRIVLDLADQETASMAAVKVHPVYRVEYREYPYRLVVTLQDVWFDPDARVGDKPALPFSVVTHEDGTVKEMQIYLPSPCDFKVIEVDDPAKLSIDIRESGLSVPAVYTVQVTGLEDASEAFSLVEKAEFPAGYQPSALVLGDLVVVEQAFTDPASAAAVDAALRDMGYASVINERQGNELPQR
jgi:hypothetical protein